MRTLVAEDLAGVSIDVAALREELGMDSPLDESAAELDDAVDRLAARDLSPLGALESVRTVLDAVSVELPSSELTCPVANFESFGHCLSDLRVVNFDASQVGNLLPFETSP